MDTKKVTDFIASMAGKKILVAGDVMLDRFFWGDATRINPEAPVPVFNVTGETYAPGGAANAASNIAGLGGDVVLTGLIGDDEEGRRLSSLLKQKKIQISFIKENRRTSTKTRAIARGQQLLRIDQEEDMRVSEGIRNRFMEQLEKSVRDVDAVLVSDYGKGVVTEELLRMLNCSSEIVTVDPVPDHIEYYKNVTLITPNVKEAGDSLFCDIHSDDELLTAGAALTEKLNSRILITRGKDGMSLFRSGAPPLHLPTVAKEVVEVTGAGDTVIAVVTLALAAGIAIDKAVELANRAAGKVVSKVGTACISAEELGSN